MQNQDSTQLENDSSQPIIIPRQENSATATVTNSSTNSNYNLPESYHTARSYKNSPTLQTNELQFSSSINSINSNQGYSNPQSVPNISNNNISNNISNLRNPFNTSSSPGLPNFSPRADPPSSIGYFNRERSSLSDAVSNNSSLRNNVQSYPNLTSSSITRPSLLTSKLAASSTSISQLPNLQQQQQQPHESPSYQPYPNPKTASFRNSFFKGGNSHDNQPSSLSSSVNNDLPSFSFPNTINRSSNINIEQTSQQAQPQLQQPLQYQPSTSSHFKHSQNINSFTPFHNTPSVVSSSYTSAPSSMPNNLFHNPIQQNSSSSSFIHNFPPQPAASIPTTTISTESVLPSEFSRPDPITRTTTTEIPLKEPSEPELHAEDEDEPMDHEGSEDEQPPTYAEPMFSSSLSESSTLQQSNESQHLDILNHPVNDLLLMLSALLQKIVEANDNLHPHHYHQASQLHQSNKFTANVLAFHGRNVPAISLHAYLTRILKYCPVTNEVFLTLLVYFDRIAKRANAGDFDQGTRSNGDGTENGSEDQQLFVMDSYNIHRLIIAGITVASKFFSDIFYKNSRYAKVGGLPLDELNHLELQFLLLTDFRLMIQIEELQRYADLLLKFWKREQSKARSGSEDDGNVSISEGGEAQ